MPTGIYKRVKRWEYPHPFSEEHKKKLSLAKLGKKISEETRLKISVANRGKHLSEETKNRLRNLRVGIKHTEETRRKMSLASLGKKKSLQHRLNISKGKIGKAMVRGEKCWNWKGGISKIDKLCRGMREYFEWRSDIFTRDNWTCRTCNKGSCYVTAHHIKGFSKILKENNIKSVEDARKCKELWDRDNGVTLCEECHRLTDNYGGCTINKKTFQ